MAERKGTSAEELAERLVGTCDSMPDEFEDAPLSFLAEFDQHAFCCTGCGWWCEAHEATDVDGELVCDDCSDGDEDEED